VLFRSQLCHCLILAL